MVNYVGFVTIKYYVCVYILAKHTQKFVFFLSSCFTSRIVDTGKELYSISRMLVQKSTKIVIEIELSLCFIVTFLDIKYGPGKKNSVKIYCFEPIFLPVFGL